MKTSFKIISLLFISITLLCCGKKKQKECVGVGTLTNIEDTVLIMDFNSNSVMGGILSAAVNGDTSIANNVEREYPKSIMLITKENTFNQFIDKIKSANNPAFNDAERIRVENIKPDFSLNSIALIPYIRIPAYASHPKHKILYSLSFELYIDSIEKTVTVNINTKDNYNGEKVGKHTALLVIPKIDLSYTIKTKFNQTNCKKRIL